MSKTIRSVKELIKKAYNIYTELYNKILFLQAERRFQNKGGEKPIKILILSDKKNGYWGDSQIDSMYWYRKELRLRGVYFSHKLITVSTPLKAIERCDHIFFREFWLTPHADTINFVKTLNETRDAQPEKPHFVFIENGDSVSVYYPEVFEYVDAYVKRHVFKDRNEYTKPQRRGSNLVEYVIARYGDGDENNIFRDHQGSDAHIISIKPITPGVKVDQLHKIICFQTFGADKWAYELHRDLKQGGKEVTAPIAERKFDVVCRARIANDWLGYLRRAMLPVMKNLQELGYRVITPEQAVNYEGYKKELGDTKIAICPFGNGEVCRRDYEAALLGAAIFHPDMSHIECHPNIFIPYETYIPTGWTWEKIISRDAVNHKEKNVAATIGAYLSNADIQHNQEHLQYMANNAMKIARESLSSESSISRIEKLLSEINSLSVR